MRQSLIVGNWKMTGTLEGSKQLAAGIVAGLNKTEAEIAVCAPYVYLPEISQQIADTPLGLGSQNVADQKSGAYTGEVSSSMLKEIGCDYAIVGHSERRSYYGDTNESVAERYCQALENDVCPILCVGETLEQRESGDTFSVVKSQLDAVIERAGIASFANAVIAYEPVWAIGTGKTASDDQAQEVHAFIRQLLAKEDAAIADGMRILYGGSVKPANAKGLFAMADIDGGLVGGASLDAASFLAIYDAAA